MKRFFSKFKKRKNKWLFYILFWILFPLTIIAAIISLAFTPGQIDQNKSTSYVNGVEINVNFANNKNAINNLAITNLEAKEASSNYVKNLKVAGFNSINVQPYVYSKQINGNKNYFYGLHIIFPSQSLASLFNTYNTANTLFANSSTMTLDYVYPETMDNIVQNKPSLNAKPSYTYYQTKLLAGLKSINNQNDITTVGQNNFLYSSIKFTFSKETPLMDINLADNVNLTNLISNNNAQIFWWTNKAAFVSLCNNLYSLYWLQQQWDLLGNIIPSDLYNNQTYSVISNLLNSFAQGKYLNLAEALYSVVGNNNFENLNINQANHYGSLTEKYNLISTQNIDNILLSNYNGKSIYSQFSNLLGSYILADINSKNYTTFFKNINHDKSATMQLNMENDLYFGRNFLARINWLISQWKNNMLNPVLSPSNEKSADVNTYSNVNINPFCIFNNINDLLKANKEFVSSLENGNNNNNLQAFTIKQTNNLAIKSSSSPTVIKIPYDINNKQGLSIVYTTKYVLKDSIVKLSAWSAMLVTILILILLIGIIVSILYRFPGAITWLICTCTLGLSALTYHDLSITTTNATMFAYLMGYFLTFFIFLIYLQKIEDFYRSGISYNLAFIKGIKYYVAYGFDFHIIIFLFSLGFTYFSTFQLETIGIVLAIYFVISFLINYLLGWLLLYLFSNFDFESRLYLYTSKWSIKQNKKNYQNVSEFAAANDPGSHYDLSAIDSILFTKNKLSIYLDINKKRRLIVISFLVVAIIIMVLFAILAITRYFTHGYYTYPILDNSSSHNILGDYLFKEILVVICISSCFSAIYLLLRFGKGIVFLFSNLLSSFTIICFFLFCAFIQNVINIEGLTFALYACLFINAYVNILLNHLFKFKVDVTAKEARNMMLNVLFKQTNTYFLMIGFISLFLFINLIFNSASLYILDFLIFIPFIFVWPISFVATYWVRYVYVLVKNLFNKIDNDEPIENYDLIEEQSIEGINSFKVHRKEEFIYE